MARRQFSTRGRYLIAGAALTTALCMITGGIVNHEARDVDIGAQEIAQYEQTNAAVNAIDSPAAQTLHKRTGAGSGSGSERQGDTLRPPQPDREGSPAGSGTSSPGERFGKPDVPSDINLSSLKSVDFGIDYQASAAADKLGDQSKRPIANDGGWMKSKYEEAGKTLLPLFATMARNLPEGEGRKIPPSQKPGDYGYVRSEAVEVLPAQLVSAVKWITASKDVPAKLDVVTWTHATSTSASQKSSQGSSSGSADYPATNTKFQMSTLPGDRLLITPGPMGSASDEDGSRKPPESKTVAMRFASDLWDFEWQQACKKTAGCKADGIHYIMGTADPKHDKATIEVLLWAAGADGQHIDVNAFSGHDFTPDSDVGTVLLGTPFGQNVARFLIHHKATYGFDRKIVAMRFWSFHKTEQSDAEYAMMATFSGVDGYVPILKNNLDIDPNLSSPESVSSAGSGAPLEMQFRPGPPPGTQRQPATQAQAAVQGAPKKPAFQLGGDSSSDSS